MQAVSRETTLLAGHLHLDPTECNQMVMTFIDKVNERLAYDRRFWARKNTQEALRTILSIADSHFDLKGRLSGSDAYMKPYNQEIGFQVFQIATLSFAYSASTQWKQRRFMGIRKGFLG